MRIRGAIYCGSASKSFLRLPGVYRIASSRHGCAVAVGALVVRATNVASGVEGEGTMYVVIRSYTGQGASELFDALVESEEDV